MRIKSFRIENFRNLRLAECENPPDFMVIGGANGSGKSAILSALMTAKEQAGSYGGFVNDPRAVSAGAETATITMTVSFSENERTFLEQRNSPSPEEDSFTIRLRKDGGGALDRYSQPIATIFGYHARSQPNPPGFFDYIDAHRQYTKGQLNNWDTSILADDQIKQTLASSGEQKFRATKHYLSSLKMQDLQAVQKAIRKGKQLEEVPDSLKDLRIFFDAFFAPMRFEDVYIDTPPFQFVISTPNGKIDIDDLSSGEKEILYTYIRFHQLRHKDAIILFDEADTHLHPDLERRYLEVLRTLSAGNQLWLTTHSPEMMIAAGTTSLYTVMREPAQPGDNQFARVTKDEQLHDALVEIMGARGVVSFNQRVVFIEGEESSADFAIYQKLYPPADNNVSFVPAGNSATVRTTAERVNLLLEQGQGFQQYYSIVDGDIERSSPAPATGNRLFKLPVYHVENFLLDEANIFKATKTLLGSKCPFTTASDVGTDLKTLVLQDGHLKPFVKAMTDARIAAVAKQAQDAIFSNNSAALANLTVPTFTQIEQEAIALLGVAVSDGAWTEKCKGRDILRAFCVKHSIKYEHFRNLLIEQLVAPPPGLATIMTQILA